MQRYYEDFIENLSVSIDGEDLERAMSNLLGAFEISRFAYLSLPLSLGTHPRFISNYPSAWTSHYLQMQYQAIDPVISCAECSDIPFNWGKRFSLHSSSVAGSRFFEEAAEFGISSGLSIPIHDLRGGSALLTFATDEDRPALVRLSDRYTRAFQLIATSYHIKARQIYSGDLIVDGIKFTRREFECLQWAAKGKSAWETGEILGIRRRTVAFHLDNARAKLGVRTVAQAIVRLANGNKTTG